MQNYKKFILLKRELLPVFLMALMLFGCSLTPEPLTSEKIDALASERIDKYTANQETVTRPITLYEAMARAVKYNLDYKIELMNEALKVEENNLALYDLLPRVVANGAYEGRDNYSGASSSQILGPRRLGDQSLVSSTSSERDFFTADISISWDVLDFGLSYVRAQQKADEVLIAEERKRKVVNRIIEDVRTAYWRAVSAERLILELEALETDIRGAFTASEQAYERRQTQPLSALNYQRELLDINETIQELQRDMIVAKQQLAALINIDPSQPYELVIPDRSASQLEIALEPDKIIEVALRNRPELREISYRQRINEREATVALLEMLPSLRATGGFNYSDNTFLFNSNWLSWAIQASWSVVKAFRYPQRRKTVEAYDDVLQQQALALTMAVVTQVHASLSRFTHAHRVLDSSKKYHDVQQKILAHIDSGVASERIGMQTLIREKMNTLVSNAKYDVAFANLQNAYANIYASMGIDPYGEDIKVDEGVEEIAEKIETFWNSLGDRISYGSENQASAP